MELDLTWILIGLPVAFALGWLASRLDLRQMRLANRQAPRAYFKGLNYLLNEQQDKAIDAFIEAVQNDPDTSELHFALGNLFRRRGEYDRAVRVHEHLLSRADLSAADRQRAQHGLALDFLKAGLLDRAEDALRKLEASAYEGQARLARLAIYERSREWHRAEEVAQLLETSGEANFSVRRAHYRCEQARESLQSGDAATALHALLETVRDHPDAPRARIMLGQLQLSQGHAQNCLSTLWPLFAQAHPAAGLAAQTLAKAARDSGEQARVRQVMLECYARQPALDILEALAVVDADPPGQRYLEHLHEHASLLAASRWMAAQSPSTVPAQVQRAIEQAARPLARYRCAACGFEAREHFWHCPGCQTWDSYPPKRIEEV
jgi:lipopolysaccharide biosynthesis regulator YciM